MTTHIADMEVLKDIPGYKAIMKAVLKTQIQLLVEQLSDHTGEESIILTASVNDGSLSHLGSSTGKGFLDGREEIKSQFLGYCLKSHHKKKTQETEQPYQRSNVSHPSPRPPMQHPSKRLRPHPVSVSKSPQTTTYPSSSDTNAPPAKRPFQERTRPRQQTSESFPNIQEDISVTPVIKQEQFDNENQTVGASEETDHSSNTSFSVSESLPSSLQLSHTQTLGDGEYGETSQADDSNAGDNNFNIEDNAGIKIEPATDAEMDLEITGVEMAEGTEGAEGNWGQNVSGAMGYEPSGPGDDSFDQSVSQSGYEPHQIYADESLPVEIVANITTARYPTVYGRCRGRRGSGKGRGRGSSYRSQQSRLARLATGTAQFGSSSKVKPAGSVTASGLASSLVPKGYKKCELCGKVLKNVSMSQHRQAHLGIKNHECDYCGKKFTQKAALVTHRRIHTGEKPFSCQLCGKLFTALSGVTQHSRRCNGPVIVDYAVYLNSDQ